MADPERAQGCRRCCTRCGFVALIGAPNAGKSTLLNALVGAKVAIVSHKVQTTRTLVRGIALAGAAQLVFIDTPGIFQPRRRLDRAMVSTAWSGAREADLVGVLIDARKGLDEEASAILDRLGDVRRAESPDPQQDRCGREVEPACPRPGGERARDVCRDLHDLGADRRRRRRPQGLARRARARGPWHYPPDQMSDAPLRQLAAEITREKLYLRLHQELPYQSTVETESWTALKDGSVRIEQTIYVERESQRKIVLGKGGQTIKAIGAEARKEIAEARGGAGAPVPVRQGARGLGRRPGTLPRDGAGISQKRCPCEDAFRPLVGSAGGLANRGGRWPVAFDPRDLRLLRRG